MRTTLDIDEDVLQAAKELAARQGTTAGKVISELARNGLKPQRSRARRRVRNGLEMLPRRGDVITLEHVEQIMDAEGI